jgi:hypothetical protein
VEAKVQAKRHRGDPEGKLEKPIAIIMDLHSLMMEIWRQRKKRTAFLAEYLEDFHSNREQISWLRRSRAKMA